MRIPHSLDIQFVNIFAQTKRKGKVKRQGNDNDEQIYKKFLCLTVEFVRDTGMFIWHRRAAYIFHL